MLGIFDIMRKLLKLALNYLKTHCFYRKHKICGICSIYINKLLNAYTILVRKPQGKERALGTLRYKWEDDHQVWHAGMHWIHLCSDGAIL
jgi:hypothetical protein